MAENTNTRITVETWAKITYEQFVKKATALGISTDGALAANRFIHHTITSANGDPDKVIFMFDYYLNFVDWGVGKGTTLEHRILLEKAGFNRQRKQWFTGVFYHEVKVLSHLLAEKYKLKAAHVLIDTANKD
ncbi:MAG TPA: hypothetical protein VLH16_02755 [Bacteroidales bacterium]|nr:hypothetical protein [Bacteroidales bacterium]